MHAEAFPGGRLVAGIGGKPHETMLRQAVDSQKILHVAGVANFCPKVGFRNLSFCWRYWWLQQVYCCYLRVMLIVFPRTKNTNDISMKKIVLMKCRSTIHPNIVKPPVLACIYVTKDCLL